MLNGDLQENAPSIDPPPDNTILLAYAQSDGRVYSGTTHDRPQRQHGLGHQPAARRTTVNLANDPIIYVTNGACSATLLALPQRRRTTTTSSTCGNVYVSGNYSSSLTIAAANDIIIDGNVTTNLVRDRGARAGRQQLHPRPCTA